jgi:peptidoglycan/xylan/chitin deacetylase (PgdA/CDA1 family)
MDPQEAQTRRLAQARASRRQIRRRRLAALGSLTVVLAAIVVIAIGSTGGFSSKPTANRTAGSVKQSDHQPGTGPRSTVTGTATGSAGTAPVPILMYHVIAPAPSGAALPSLYVPQDEFAAQMQALKAAGWRAVTMDQLEAYWKRGVPLGSPKPIVISFDNGYHSQYANALPVLKQLGWVGTENLQLNGLPPSQGGLTDAEIRGLVAVGWELDTQGISDADLVGLDSSELHSQVADARQIVQRRYGVPVNWFSYPSGDYDASVIAEVKADGFAGSTTVVPGWASPSQDPYRLPRLRVLGGTSPQALLAQIASAQSASAPPESSSSG